jgi:c-di-GMP-related signal transduction protein
MELAPDVRAALLGREDFYGAVLGLVESYEQGWWDQVDSLAASVGVNPVTLAPHYLDALAWATEHARPMDEPAAAVGARR